MPAVIASLFAATRYARGKTMVPAAYRVLYRIGHLVRQGRLHTGYKEAEADRQRIQAEHPQCIARTVPLWELDRQEQEQLDAAASSSPEEIAAVLERRVADQRAAVPAQHLGDNEGFSKTCNACERDFLTADAAVVRCHLCAASGRCGGWHSKRGAARKSRQRKAR